MILIIIPGTILERSNKNEPVCRAARAVEVENQPRRSTNLSHIDHEEFRNFH